MTSRRVRLVVWVVAVAGALAWPVFVPTLVWFQIIFLLMLALLWWAAPGDSIRLPFAWSAVLIVGGAMLLQSTAVVRGESAAVSAIASMLILMVLVILMRSSSATVWALAPLAWAWWTTLHGWGLLALAVPGAVLVSSLRTGLINNPAPGAVPTGRSGGAGG